MGYFDIEKQGTEEMSAEPAKKGFFSRLKDGLSKTRKSFVSGMDSIFGEYDAIDDDFYEDLEETMIMADIGINATDAILEDLKKKVKEQHIKNPSECRKILIDTIREHMHVD